MRRVFKSYAATLCACVFILLFHTPLLSSDQTPMLFYQVKHDLLRTSDHFSVSVYDDGLALIHYPHYMDKSGDYVVQLSASEVQEIRLLLNHPLVQDFDDRLVAAEKEVMDAQSQELFTISDDSYSHFEINIPGAEKSVRWANVAIEAKRYPQIGVIRKLAEIQAKMLQLDQHPTAEAVAD